MYISDIVGEEVRKSVRGAQKLRGCLAGEFAELPGEMRLIEVSGFERDLSQIAASKLRHRVAKALDALQAFRREPDQVLKAAAPLAVSSRQNRRALRTQAFEQKALECSNAARGILEWNPGRSPEVLAREHLSAQMVLRYPSERRKPKGLESHAQDIDPAQGLNHNRPLHLSDNKCQRLNGGGAIFKSAQETVAKVENQFGTSVGNNNLRIEWSGAFECPKAAHVGG